MKEIKKMRKLAEDLQLDNCAILRKYNIQELNSIYNGIGPDAFPDWLRDAISALHPSLAVVALIHDVEWHESDLSKESFAASNDRFKQNGYAVAKSQFAWYNPRRWIVMNQARRFGNICQALGWSAWSTPCACAVCEKNHKKEQKKCIKSI